VKTHDRVGWRFAAFYFISFAAFSMFTIYGSLYFQRRGVTHDQLGKLFAIPALMNILAPPLWGMWSDALRQRKLPTVLMHLITAAVFPLFWFWSGDSCLVLYGLMVLFAFFFMASIPLGDAWTLDHIAHRGGDYGKLRSWGSIGFIVPLFASLWVLKSSSVSTARDLLPIFVAFSVFRVLSGLYALFLPDDHARAPKSRLDWQGLKAYAHPFALTFFFAVFVNQFLGRSYYTFFSIYLDEQGIQDNWKGMYWVVAVSAETCLMLVSGALLKRFGAVSLLLVGNGAMALRTLIYALEPSWQIILATQTLHAFTFGAFHVASIQVVDSITPKTLRATGQTVYGAVMGLGGFIGGVAGGKVAESLGLPGLYLVLAVLAGVTTAMMALMFLRWPRQE